MEEPELFQKSRSGPTKKREGGPSGYETGRLATEAGCLLARRARVEQCARAADQTWFSEDSPPWPTPRAPAVVRRFTLLSSVQHGFIALSGTWPRTPRSRDQILSHLRIGLRTFYRELELLKRCGVKVRHQSKLYTLLATAEQAEGRLPFPDPQLSFAEMAELAACPCEAGKRLAELLSSVVSQPPPSRKRGFQRPGTKGQGLRFGGDNTLESLSPVHANGRLQFGAINGVGLEPWTGGLPSHDRP